MRERLECYDMRFTPSRSTSKHMAIRHTVYEVVDIVVHTAEMHTLERFTAFNLPTGLCVRSHNEAGDADALPHYIAIA